MRNYTAAHESRSGFVGEERFLFPPNHIEVDNRLTWLLGRLERAYGDNAIYVHLKRNDRDTARSFLKRYGFGIIEVYRSHILMRNPPGTPPMSVCLDYCDTVNANIEAFLKNKTRKMTVSLETVKEDFRKFWELVGAEGDWEKAVAEWDNVYNATPPDQNSVLKPEVERPFLGRLSDALDRQLETVARARVKRLPKANMSGEE